MSENFLDELPDVLLFHVAQFAAPLTDRGPYDPPELQPLAGQLGQTALKTQ